MRPWARLSGSASAAVLAGLCLGGCRAADPHWTAAEVGQLRGLWIGNLGPPPPDASNRVADDPAAAGLGRSLFFDARLSANGRVACATCHQPGRFFTDGREKARALGESRRHVPSLVGAAYAPWLFWDGRADSLWAQALGPLEDPAEHGLTRVAAARLAYRHHRAAYEALFGPMPPLDDADRFPDAAGPIGDPAARAAWTSMAPGDRTAVERVFASLGKCLAAFERTLRPGPARFDTYVAALDGGDARAAGGHLTAAEVKGLRLFIGKARCIQCHSGPRLTNDGFHNIGLAPHAAAVDGERAAGAGAAAVSDAGRAEGVWLALDDPFNCAGEYSDAGPDDCVELGHVAVVSPSLDGAFKTPSLRNVGATAPYMHDGRFADLAGVIAHYDAAPRPFNGVSDLVPLGLTPVEKRQLEAFLGALAAPVAEGPNAGDSDASIAR